MWKGLPAVRRQQEGVLDRPWQEQTGNKPALWTTSRRLNLPVKCL